MKQRGGLSRPFAIEQDQPWLDRKDRHNVMIAVDDDDLIAHDEVEVSTPFRMDLYEHRRHFDHAHAGRHDRADAQGEVDVVDARRIAAGQHRLPDLGALLGRQVDRAAAAAALLSLAARRALLTLLGLTLFALRRALVALPLGRRALLALALTRGLIPVALAALGLALLVFALALLALLLLRRLASGLPIARGLALLALVRHALLRLTAALLRRLRTLLRASSWRALALGRAGLAATTRHLLRRCQ